MTEQPPVARYTSSRRLPWTTMMTTVTMIILLQQFVQRTNGEESSSCGVWLAPSTIAGAGIGMYAGRDFKERDELLVGGDSVVAISDLPQHNAKYTYSSFLWDEYTWNAGALKMLSEGVSEVNVASPGFGAAANCFLPIFNVEEWYPRLVDSGLHRSRDAGAGASTVFHHRRSLAKRDIGAGEEFFVSYGSEWFESRPQLGPIPLYEDLETATTLLKKYKTLALNKTIVSDIWDTFVKRTAFNQSRVLAGAFHNTETELSYFQQHDNNVTTARIADSHRSLQWLGEHGTCGDHIVPDESKVPQAGRGAFASRTLPADTIVAQLPMIHVTNRSRFNMYRLERDSNNQIVPLNDQIVGKQLLLNYCYGHSESTLLLCPYGPMVNYVNHHSKHANVRLQWATRGGNHMPELLKSSIEDLQNSDATAKLAMELVATRKIAKGEEILLDYGDEWERAWQAHVSNWQKPYQSAETYKSAAQMNAELGRLPSVFEEGEKQTYPPNVEMQCDTSVHAHPVDTKQHMKAGTLEEFLWEEEAAWWPCSILRFHVNDDGVTMYTVHMYQLDDNGRVKNGLLVEDFPRLAFQFVDKPYTADAYLTNAFRHDIRIPDKIFPESWRNLRKDE